MVDGSYYIQVRAVTSSARIQEKKNGEVQDAEEQYVDLPVKAAAAKKERRSNIAPTWSTKLERALNVSVKSWTGHAKSGGVAWKNVYKEMAISKHHVDTQWKKMQAVKPPATTTPKKTKKVRIYLHYLS